MSGEFSGFGFAPGVVRGARSFKIDKLGRLTGIHYAQVWRPGENDAECRRSDDPYVSITAAVERLSAALAYAAPNDSGGRRGRRTSSAFGGVGLQSEPVPVRESPHTLEQCKCGFYAYYDGSDDYHREGYVSGVIEGYGEAIIGTRGFRSMRARLVALHIPEDVAGHMTRLVERNYAAVPQFGSFEAMVSAFPPDAGAAAVSPDTDPDFWTREI